MFYNIEVKEKESRVVIPMSSMKIGQIGMIVDDLESSYGEQVVIRSYNSIVSLTNPRLTWKDTATLKVRIFPPGTVLTIREDRTVCKQEFVNKEELWFSINESTRTFTSIRRAETLAEGFEKSIVKWELLCKGYDADGPKSTCGLCDLYVERKCHGCPVRKHTGRYHCYGTPYHNAPTERTLSFTSRQAELELLISLHKKAIRKGEV